MNELILILNLILQICEGIISRITPPLIWIEIAPEIITVLPHNSCDLFPLGWCHKNGFQAVKLLRPTKKKNTDNNNLIDESQEEVLKNNEDDNSQMDDMSNCMKFYFMSSH